MKPKHIAGYLAAAVVVGWIGRLYIEPTPRPESTGGQDHAYRHSRLLEIRVKRPLTPGEQRELDEARRMVKYEVFKAYQRDKARYGYYDRTPEEAAAIVDEIPAEPIPAEQPTAEQEPREHARPQDTVFKN